MDKNCKNGIVLLILSIIAFIVNFWPIALILLFIGIKQIRKSTKTASKGDKP